MSTPRRILLSAMFFLAVTVANAQVSPASDAAPPGTIPLSSLIATVAKKTGRKFVLDPRVRANIILIGERPSSVTYNELVTILETYGYVAAETGGYVLVVPDAYVRTEPLPFISGNEKRPDDEYVTTVIHVRSIPAAWFVPILRPLLPQQAHLAAMPCANALVMVDRYANVRRIESIIKAMDTGEPIKPPSCSVPMPRSH